MNKFLAGNKRTLALLGLAMLAATGVSHAAAADVIDAVDGLSGDASLGVTAGVTIGAVVFGAKVVWGAIKSMA
ncbi:hypothetical protein [Luteolibacter soli]|uniref:Methyltransferase n=1 Tax=Luteolibacter soli TaxID=3135280 RepID=A0ABU9ARQ3_9BACT